MAKRQNHRKLRAFLLGWRNVELITALWLFLLFPFLTAVTYLITPFLPGDFRRTVSLVAGLVGSVVVIARSMDWAKEGKGAEGEVVSNPICRECGSELPGVGCLPVLIIPIAGIAVVMGLRAAVRSWWKVELGEGFLVFGWIGVSYLGVLIFRPFRNSIQCPKCGAKLPTG